MNTGAIALPAAGSGSIPGPDGGLSRYLRQIRRFPVLSAEEEYVLARRWREHGDTGAVHRLVTSHLRLVARVATKYRGYGFPLGDLIAEGNIGVLHAARRYDPDRGARFGAYAVWWIRAAIYEYVLRSWSLVRIGASSAQKKLFFNLRRTRDSIRRLNPGATEAAVIRKVAGEFGLPEADVIAMSHRLAGPDTSLDLPARPGEDGPAPGERLADTAPGQEETIGENEERTRRTAMLRRALQGLKGRERDIIVSRRLVEPAQTLEVLASRHGISRERVRQVEARAFRKLQEAVAADGA